ncbi:class I SAM-dependent methyltransferase [Nocardiopsis exhalans]|uniref:Class I SAM-dependent methyltransferase n=1 Tax=Nocardiopsis exhalans TaxID=163604 RepID=A0ABY5D1X9_9ACTN|nr:class I SAM-dependent methyltransferase [Nocardiopsis exhalans]USY17440.1 class I SAM-dependent methyltransferase [Nocardiopsis exhalans]
MTATVPAHSAPAHSASTADTDRAQAFAERMVGVLNDGALALMAGIGHRTGLFDTMAGLPPSTSSQIAEASGLRERYVREWLGAMTTGGVVDHDPATGTFHLPAEHHLPLTRSGGAANVAKTMQILPMLGNVSAEITERFETGGGVHYAAFADFHRFMAEESAAVFDNALIEVILPLAPELPGRLAEGIDVADIGCGSGHAVNLMAQAFPRSSFVGYDFSEEGIAAGRAEAERLGLANADFRLADVAELDAVGAFDAVTAFDAVHDQAHPARVLDNINRALRPGGRFLMVDINASSDVADNVEHPLGPFLYTVSTMHCMTVSLALGGDGLGTVWGEQLARAMLADAGFTDVEVTTLDQDPLNSYYLAAKR